MNNKELTYLKDTDFLISKHIITGKIHDLLKEVNDTLQQFIKEKKIKFPQQVLVKAGKISKGENYRLLPYLILDYPRFFNPSAVFAFRTMFWWGNFFSCTLHLQGSLLNQYRSILEYNIDHLKPFNFYISTSFTPWEYHYQKNNYQLLNSISSSEIKELIKNKPFIKLSRNISIEEHDKLTVFALDTFRLTMESIGILQKD